MSTWGLGVWILDLGRACHREGDASLRQRAAGAVPVSAVIALARVPIRNSNPLRDGSPFAFAGLRVTYTQQRYVYS